MSRKKTCYSQPLQLLLLIRRVSKRNKNNPIYSVSHAQNDGIFIEKSKSKNSTLRQNFESIEKTICGYNL